MRRPRLCSMGSFADQFGARLHVVHLVADICLNSYRTENYAGLNPQIQIDSEDGVRKEIDALLIDSDHSGPPTTGRVIAANSPAFGDHRLREAERH